MTCATRGDTRISPAKEPPSNEGGNAQAPVRPPVLNLRPRVGCRSPRCSIDNRSRPAVRPCGAVGIARFWTPCSTEDRTAICGPRYAHQADRTASRAGTVASTVVLGGRKVSIRRPRVRSGRQEVPLPTFQTMAQTDPLRRRTVEQLLVGVSTRGYARSLEPLPADIPSRSVSKSAVSRRFVAKTASQLAAWQATPLDELDLVGLLLDGVHIGASTVWSSRWGSASTARSTPSGSGKVRRRTRPSVRACSPTSRVVACAPIGASS